MAPSSGDAAAGYSPPATAPALSPAGARRAPGARAGAAGARAPAAAARAAREAAAPPPPGGPPGAAPRPPSAGLGRAGPPCPGEADRGEATALRTWGPASTRPNTCAPGRRQQTDGPWADLASVWFWSLASPPQFLKTRIRQAVRVYFLLQPPVLARLKFTSKSVPAGWSLCDPLTPSRPHLPAGICQSGQRTP